jgi:hypothetical protein
MRPHSFGDDNLFFSVWFEPFTIDAGFIVEDVQYSIKVWNAYFDVTKQITAINEVAPEGTELTHGALPITIAKFGDVTFTLTVLEEGPPVQATTYTFTVAGTDFTTEITGIRVVPFTHEPDYRQKIDIVMRFETAIARNKYFAEQRRPLRLKALWDVGVGGWAKGVAAQKLRNELSYGHDKVFGVPLYSEPCYPSGAVTGQTTINCSNDLSKHWYLNNQATYVVLIDHDSLDAEIKEVSSIGANAITLTRAVTKTFSWQNVMVYPVVLSVLRDISAQPETTDVLSFRLQFTEYKNG